MPAPDRFAIVRAWRVAAPGRPCEDALAVDRPRGLAVLADGASESYAGRTWARLVARGFLREFPGRPPERAWWRAFLRRRSAEYRACFAAAELSWYHELARERGSHCTLLAAAPAGRDLLVIAAGDSCALLFDGPRLAAAWPYSSSAEFERDPLLLPSSMEDIDPFLEAGGLQLRLWRLSRLERPSVALATDALARWLLVRPESSFRRLCRLAAPAGRRQVLELVRRLQAEDGLGRDDCSFALLRPV